MNEQQYNTEKKEQTEISVDKMTSIQGTYKANEKIQLFIMWQIYNKRYTVGTKLFYGEIERKVNGVNKQAYAKARLFLEGANLLVDEVIIADKVPNHLIERFGLRSDQTKSQN
ncbi:hypothetical protein [Enterococcus sp. 5H]|uniref:hypothetical protein n=1 Tax=Enterococcus sp. 5H TaxID=1229490 RepID=UPI002302315F|nr:hypothetical protein [Enterococcus sp. 5H]MDA9469893.1 hypothetical protein [Enterococcus sp. 5H]